MYRPVFTPEHYALLEKAVLFIEHHFKEQPSLEALAHQFGLSAPHFQRVFKEGVGISPKRFLQYTTLKHAKNSLKQNSVLDASMGLGLSSTSRLYDLFIECDGVSPGVYKQKGQGLELIYGLHETPFGPAFIALSPKGICEFSFLPDRRHKGLSPLEYLQKNWPEAQIRRDHESTKQKVNEIFREQGAQKIYLHLKGTNFQIKVWQALLQIQTGDILSYQDVAQSLGQPKASRAVGSAVGKNPISFLIPCHRVLRQDGGVGGYAGGTARKRIILAYEKALNVG